MHTQHTISAILPSTYQNLFKFMEIWQSSDRNKNAHGVFSKDLHGKLLAACKRSWRMVQALWSTFCSSHLKQLCLIQQHLLY